MAKPLDDRITAALGKDARAATVADLQRELAALIAKTTAERDRHAATAVSPTIDEATADVAADEVPKLDRKIIRLNAKAGLLATRHQELMESERRRDTLADYAQVKERRDALVADLTEQWPKLTEAMIALLKRIEESDAECARRGSVYGQQELTSAEIIARDCGGFWGTNPIARLADNNIEHLVVDKPGMRGRAAWTAPRNRQWQS